MRDTVLFAAAEALISHELGVDVVLCSGCDSCFLYDGSSVEVFSSEYIDEQEPPYFNIPASERTSDICVFSVKKGLNWDFYIMRSSVLVSCSDGLSRVGLPLVEPVSLHAKIDGIKQAVNLACNI
ncbi:MAG: hypothetical protein NC452_03870 [Eubacterium sp.]|nr:hypothetical protein [Eubacterium sp.]